MAVTCPGSRPVAWESAVAWELRTAMALVREVVVVVDGDRRHVRGYVVGVAASDAFAVVWDGAGDAHFPMERILAVRRPHFSEPLDGRRVSPPSRRGVLVLDGQLAFRFDNV